MRMDSLSRLAVALVCVALSGCATLDLPWPNRIPEASLKNPVVRVLCLWEPSEGRDPKGLPCRGFAGQILFLGNQGGRPVKVNGTVKVYQFDDLGTEEEQAVPVHQFEFDAGAWNRHMKVGSFGAAYHVFIPYMRPGHHEANCAVYLKYTPHEGQPITSDMSHIYVKGRPRDDLAAARLAQNPEYVRMYDKQVQTTTIPMDDRSTIPAYSPQDAAKADQLLHQLLLDQPDAVPQPTVEVDDAPVRSARIRWDGERVDVQEPRTE